MSGSAKWDGPAKELTTKIRLIVGPVNSAGQGTAWARAVDQYVDDASAHSCSFRRDPQRYESDYLISAETYKTDWDFRAEFSRYLIPRFTHALLEGDAPLFARVGQRDVAEDIALLRERGVQVALIAHGSDVRLPSHHVEIEPWSPFRSMDPDVYKRMEAFAKRTARIFNAYPGPVFISTPDLIEFVPAATWCPVIVDPERWASAQGVFERNIPIVAHAPSSSDMKGSDLIDPLLERLHADGVIEYRRVQDIEPKEMPAIYGDADIVVDQLALGSYGVAACEAMAAGRIVLGHVSEQVRSAAQEAAGLDLPILEVTPDSIVERIRELLADRESARDTAARGPEFVRTLHDGRRSASVLADFLRNGDRAPAHWLPGVVGQRVVMMAGNDIIVDSRVMKYAQTAAQWGLDVIAIGIAGKYFRGVEMFDGVSVRCLVVPRRYNVKRRGAWQALTPWYNEEADRKRDVARLAYDRRELRADRARTKRDMLREPLTKPPRSPCSVANETRLCAQATAPWRPSGFDPGPREPIDGLTSVDGPPFGIGKPRCGTSPPARHVVLSVLRNGEMATGVARDRGPGECPRANARQAQCGRYSRPRCIHDRSGRPGRPASGPKGPVGQDHL